MTKDEALKASLTAMRAIAEGCSFPADDVQRAVRDRARAAVRDIESALAAPAEEPVAWLYEDTLPHEYPYDEMFPHSAVRDGVRMFPVFAPSERKAHGIE